MLSALDPYPYITSYMYSLFRVTSDGELVQYMTYGVIIYAISVLLLPFAAPYGRYYTSNWFGFGVPPRFAWIVQEGPAFVIPFLFVITDKRPAYTSLTNQICLGMYIMHYFQRSFIYPILMKTKTNVPFLPFFFAFITNIYNGTLHSVYFGNFYKYDDDWLYQPYLWVGVLMFLVGMKINIGGDATLRNLKAGKDKTYKIPKGGMFEYVSCANYFGEILEMWGYALTSLAPPAIAHALFTSCFLIRRATQHHQWYLKKFDNYPPHRKAVIPFLL